MSVHAQPRMDFGMRPLGFPLVIGLAAVLGLAVLMGGELAIPLVIGAMAFLVFMREPVLGLYATTALLLLSGIISAILPVGATAPATGAKLCALATGVAWALNVLMRRTDWRLPKETIIAVGFIAWALLGVANSAMWRDQLPQWGRLATLVVYFFLAVNLLNDPGKLRRFVLLLVGCGILMAVFALAQYALPSLQFAAGEGISGVASGAEKAFVDTEGVTSGAAVRVSGGAGHSNWLAMTLLLILPLNVYWYSMAKSRRIRLYARAAIAIEVGALIVTFTRMGLVVGMAVAVVLITRRLVRFTAYRLAALAFAAVLAWFLLPSAYRERVLNITEYASSSSTQTRISLQRHAWDYTEESPLVGVGIGGFGLHLQDEQDRLGATLRWLIDHQGWDPVYYGPHNMYLQLSAETGFIGLIVFLILMVILIRKVQVARGAFARLGDEPAATLGASLEVSLFAFVICAVFLHALFQKVWWMLAAAAVTYAILAAQAQARALSKKSGGENGAAAQPAHR